MKLAILGASGKTGIPLVQQALEGGHHVVALVRTPSKLPIQHANLTVIQGDAMNADDTDKAIQGVDAVVNALGHVKGSPENLQVTVITNVLKSMEKHKVKRLITLTGAGVRDPQDKPKVIDHVFGFLLKMVSGKVLEDSAAYINLVRQSKTDWTVIRGPRLTEGEHTGKAKMGYVGAESGTSISRADLAELMLKQLTDSTYVKKAPAVWS